ncbi:DUF3299 domain-containing protein [Ruegeria arenilitoris]|uniref:DUF3299 domain-containing protein n=1 Tax=Ruegeria arenilitoris TaxID=1173585 RepID=UPI00147C208F|nr:DUF3299 domain-containing protein [Ruegeria arenilitoris]
MFFRIKAVVLTCFFCVGAGSVVCAGISVDWVDLPDPTVQIFEDPYRDLTPEQFDDVLLVVRLRGRLQQNAGSEEERLRWQELLTETEDVLADDGVNVDWLLSQREVVKERREKAATAGNPLYDGRTVTLAGFAIPAPPDASGKAIAYLVPERGMCSHMPPPPPNQMIRVQLNGNWTPAYFHEPVRLTGKLEIAPSNHQMVVVDGLMPMQATFQLEAAKVETLESREDQLEWSESAAKKLRAAGARKTGGRQASE